MEYKVIKLSLMSQSDPSKEIEEFLNEKMMEGMEIVCMNPSTNWKSILLTFKQS